MSDCAPSQPSELAHSVAGRSSSPSHCSASRVVAILKRAGLDYTLISFGKTHQARWEYRVCWCRLDDKIPKTQQIADALIAAGVKCSTDAMHSVNQAAVYLRLPNGARLTDPPAATDPQGPEATPAGRAAGSVQPIVGPTRSGND